MSIRYGIIFSILSIIKARRKIMYKNSSIKCDVKTCKHNADGTSCELTSIKVGCCDCGGQQTCCESFDCVDCTR